jgi:hypothetical protein
LEKFYRRTEKKKPSARYGAIKERRAIKKPENYIIRKANGVNVAGAISGC